jgi:HAD superfamily hydrolase (TIGR01509 family)
MNLDLHKYKCAIFDLDGTLLDSTWVWHKIDVDFLGKRGIPITEDFLEDIKAHNFHTGSRYVIERFGLNEQPEDIEKEWFDMAIDEYTHHIGLKPNAKEFLEQVKAAGLKIAVATSSDSSLYEGCLRRNGIYEYFDNFTETREVLRGKGYPDVYERAAKKCDAKNHECIVFEDILVAVQGAKMGNFFTVGMFDQASAAHEQTIKEICDLYIRDYKEIM